MATIDAQQLGTWVKNRRKAKGFTQTDLSERSGISRYQIIRIENGETTTRRRTIAALALALDAPEGDALRLAGYVSSPSPAAEIGAQIADLIEPLEPREQRALCTHLREVARSWVASVTGRNAESSSAGEKKTHYSVLYRLFYRTTALLPAPSPAVLPVFASPAPAPSVGANLPTYPL